MYTNVQEIVLLWDLGTRKDMHLKGEGGLVQRINRSSSQIGFYKSIISKKKGE
jgi:hypothetical protein